MLGRGKLSTLTRHKIMGSTIAANGSCLCGAVTIKAKAMSTDVGACHCNFCRKWTGGPLMTVDCKSDVEIDGQEHVSVFKSSDWAERGFCSHCGSHLFYRLKQHNQYIVPDGLFDPDQMRFDHQIFVDEKPRFGAEEEGKKDPMTGAAQAPAP